MTVEPRPGVRDVQPYVSPHPPVAVRLNTNECPVPLPEDFAEDLARTVRDGIYTPFDELEELDEEELSQDGPGDRPARDRKSP